MHLCDLALAVGFDGLHKADVQPAARAGAFDGRGGEEVAFLGNVARAKCIFERAFFTRLIRYFADVAAWADGIALAEQGRALVNAAPRKYRAPCKACRNLFAARVRIVVGDVRAVAVAELFLQKAKNPVAYPVLNGDVGINTKAALELTADPRGAG